MSKRTKILLPVFAVVLGLVGSVVAYAGWCWSDPIIGLKANGSVERDLVIDVAVPEEYRNSITDDIMITVTHPKDVTPRVKFMDGVLPEKVVFVKSNWDSAFMGDMFVEIKVRVPGNQMFDAKYDIRYTNTAGQNVTQTITGISNMDMYTSISMKR